LTFDLSAGPHSLTLSRMQRPVLAELLVDTFDQTAKERQTGAAGDTSTAHENSLPFFLSGYQLRWDVWTCR
jgi:hypothetical protein